MTRRIIKLVVVTLLFYMTGRLAYEYFYRMTISIVKSLSTVPLKFFGKFPFWFFGDPKFGLIIASIPLTVFLTYKLLSNRKKGLFETSVIYAMYFVMTYLMNCWVISLGLLASNDFYKDGQELSYNLRQINLNQIYLISVSISTILTAVTLTTIKLIVKYKSNNNERRKAGNSVRQNANT